MSPRPLSEPEIADLEDKLSGVLKGLSDSDDAFDVDTEFEQIMFSTAGQSEETMEEVREMSRRFGPKLVKMLGFPAAAGVCKIRVLDNGMREEVHIDPPSGDGLAITANDILEKSNEQKIVFGLDVAAIDRAAECGKTETVEWMAVAVGTPVQPGRDGYIDVTQATSAEKPAPPPAEGGGHIPAADITTVSEGQAVAKLVGPASGVAGKDVYGWDIPAPAGKPIVPKCGKGVSFDANAGIFYAKSAGRVIVDGPFIDVEKIMVLKNDVDISVGHITFPGELMIRGWVRAGISVEADKDIVIDGGVEAAQVRSTGGSVYIGKGVQGSGMAVIHAAWDVTARFVEQASVMAGGVLTVQQSVRSDLAAGDAVLVTEGKGAVIGGHIYAGKRVEVRELGGGTGEPTIVQIGVTPEHLVELFKLKSKLQAAQNALAEAERVLARYGLSAEALESRAETPEGRKFLKLTKTVVVLHSRVRRIQAEEQRFQRSLKTDTNGVVDVRGRVHPGVKILIGRGVYQVSTPLSHVRFKYDPARRRIMTLSIG